MDVTSLAREISSLTAQLHREKQRRCAIAAHAEEESARADAADRKFAQVSYANKKLDKELREIKEEERRVELR